MHHRNKKFGGASLALFGVIALSACSGGQGGGNEDLKLSDDPVTLTVSWWGNDKRTELTGQMIDLFEKEYPNIKIETTSSDYAAYWDKLGTQVAGGNAPDVIQMADTYIRTYVTNETLFDLGSASTIIETGDFPDSALTSGEVDDTLYGLTTGTAVWAVLTNTSIFEEYGIELPDDKTWTWDDFRALAEEISLASSGAVFGTSGLPRGDQDLAWWARQHGESLWTADGGIGIAPETVADYFAFEKSLLDGAGPSAEQLVEDRAAGISAGYLATNRAAMGIYTHTQVNAVAAASGEDWTLLRIPDSSKDSFFKPAMYWSMSRTTEHPAEAATFLNFMLNDLEAAKISLTERGIPANTEVQEAIAPLLDPMNKKALEFTQTLESEVGDADLLPPPGGGSLALILQKYIDQVNFDQSTPDEAAAGFLRELQAELDTAK